MSDDNFGLQTASGFLDVPPESKDPYADDVLESLTADAQEIIARYPHKRSALLPLLHLVQSVDGYITGRGVRLCAELLDLTEAEVSGVATFYTQFKRHPNGDYTVGVCTNTLCAVMGGDEIWEAVSEHLGIGHDETTEDGKITLERIECNAGCDYAPVVMANWEFFDNQTPESTTQLVDDLRAGNPVAPTRGPRSLCSFKATSRVLAGFLDEHANEGVGAGPASLAGLEVAKENGWSVPAAPQTTGSAEADTAASSGATDKTGPVTLFSAVSESVTEDAVDVEVVTVQAAADRGDFEDGGHGEGSAKPGTGGVGPAGWHIKGNASSMLFHTPDSPWYKITKAEVWFRDADAAAGAGFTDARERRRQGKRGATDKDKA